MQNRECQVADWSHHKKACTFVDVSPQKLELHFAVNRSGAPITFKLDIPAIFTIRDCPRDLSQTWLTNVVNTREKRALQIYTESVPGEATCLYCRKPATCLYSTIMASLHVDPPTVFVAAQSLCMRKLDIQCAIKAKKAEADMRKDTDGPFAQAGGEDT